MTQTKEQTQATDNTRQHTLPKTPDEYEQYLAEKFSRILNSRHFAVYDGFLEDYYRIPRECDEFPGWVLPMRKECVLIDDGGNIVDDEKSLVSSAAGVPSLHEGAAALAMPSTMPSSTALPPITNRGATLYQNQESPIDNFLCTYPPKPATVNVKHRENTVKIPIDELPCPHIMGGYDGGVELGFDGKWPDKTFEHIIATLEAGRIASQQKHNDARFITLGGRQFLVQPYGGGKSVNYRYIIEGDGIKLYFHHKPDGGIQPVRLRYGFESLIGCNLFRVHDETRHWLNRLGFVIEKETLSRVDLQVMIPRETSDFLRPIASGQMVTKVLKWDNHGYGAKAQTFKIGSDIEICIYDKAAEMLKAVVSDPIKYCLMTMICFGRNWTPGTSHFTRIEFRLRRDALKVKGINTMQDLQEIEPALVEWLTTKWFRILDSPKVRGHENTQAVHPIWSEVQDAFRAYFPGINGVRREIQPNRKRRLSCESMPLIKQAGGCLATAIALQFGKQPTK